MLGEFLGLFIGKVTPKTLSGLFSRPLQFRGQIRIQCFEHGLSRCGILILAGQGRERAADPVKGNRQVFQHLPRRQKIGLRRLAIGCNRRGGAGGVLMQRHMLLSGIIKSLSVSVFKVNRSANEQLNEPSAHIILQLNLGGLVVPVAPGVMSKPHGGFVRTSTDSYHVATPSTCATFTISSAVVVPLRTLSLPSASRLFIPPASAALRILLVGARSKARVRISLFIAIISKIPMRPRKPMPEQYSQPRGLYITLSFVASSVIPQSLSHIGLGSRSGCLHLGHSTRMSRCASTAWMEEATRNGLTPMSMRRVMAPGASLV